MKKIQGTKRPILIPDCWADLTPAQYIFTVTRLLLLIGNQSTVTDFRIALLLNYTAYRPARRLLPRAQEATETITENLVRLAELITFPLRQGKESLEINNTFTRNPLPAIRIGRQTYKGKQFDTGIIMRTDITAREFADAFDAIRAFATTKTEECLNTLCAILYPRFPEHSRNMNSTHHQDFARLSYEIRYAVMIWFTGIVQYFAEHPVYRLLFSGEASGDRERISLGMGETIMHLSLTGFGSKTEMENVNIIDYFDLQVKSLKKMIADARGQGAKTEDIAKHTKLSYNTIEKLS